MKSQMVFERVGLNRLNEKDQGETDHYRQCHPRDGIEKRNKYKTKLRGSLYLSENPEEPDNDQYEQKNKVESEEIEGNAGHSGHFHAGHLISSLALYPGHEVLHHIIVMDHSQEVVLLIHYGNHPIMILGKHFSQVLPHIIFLREDNR